MQIRDQSDFEEFPTTLRPTNSAVDCIKSKAIAAAEKVRHRRTLESVCIPFLDRLPTKDHPVRCHQNRVLREQRSSCFGVLIVVCVVQLPTQLTEDRECIWNPEEITLLTYSWIDVFLSAKVVKAKLIAIPARASTRRIFIVYSGY